MKRYILLIMIILLSFSVLGAGSEWTSYQYDDTGRGASDVSTYNDYGDFADVTTLSKSEGDGFQPLVGDIDNDGIIEMIITEGDFLIVYNIIGSSYVEDSTINMGSPLDSMGYMADMDGDDIYEIVMSFNDTVYTINYNGSAFNTSINWDSTTNATSTEGGITCIEFSAPSWACYYAGNSTYINEYNPLLGLGSKYTTGKTLSGLPSVSPAIADIDLDGALEIVLLSTSALELEVLSLNIPSNVEWSSTLSGTEKTNGALRGFLVDNLDDSGDYEVCMTYQYSHSSATRPSILRCYNGDGTAFDVETIHQSVYSVPTGHVSPPIAIDIDNDGDRDICVLGGGATGGSSDVYNTHVMCYDASFSTLILASGFQVGTSYSSYLTASITNPPTGGLLMGSDTPAFILGNYIYTFNDYTPYTGLDATAHSLGNSKFISADVNGDGYLDLIEWGSNVNDVHLSNLTNTPPVLETGVEYSGYGSNPTYLAPICVNTSVVISAEQCADVTSTLCNYANDVIADEERLLTNCGVEVDYTTNLGTGLFTSTSPSYSCVYNTTGSYNVRVYIEDDANVGDRTQYNVQNIPILVIDGVAGVTCNTVVLGVGDPLLDDVSSATASQDAIDESIEDTLGILTGTSTTMKLLIAFAIILGLIFLASSHGITDASALAVIGMIALAFVTFFGLLPVWIMITVILSLICLVLVKIFTGKEST